MLDDDEGYMRRGTGGHQKESRGGTDDSRARMGKKGKGSGRKRDQVNPTRNFADSEKKAPATGTRVLYWAHKGKVSAGPAPPAVRKKGEKRRDTPGARF